jgi:hypothetical protein
LNDEPKLSAFDVIEVMASSIIKEAAAKGIPDPVIIAACGEVAGRLMSKNPQALEAYIEAVRAAVFEKPETRQ